MIFIYIKRTLLYHLIVRFEQSGTMHNASEMRRIVVHGKWKIVKIDDRILTFEISLFREKCAMFSV